MSQSVSISAEGERYPRSIENHLSLTDEAVIMNQIIRCLMVSACALSGLTLLEVSAIARPIAPLSQFTPAQVQRLSRDLNRSNSEDFFRQGQEKLEREVQLLNRKQNLITEDLLKVEQNTQIQQESSPFEAPKRTPGHTISN